MAKSKAVSYTDLLQARKVDFTKPVSQDKVYFSIKGNVIGTAGNFITLSGLPKAGKSRFIAAIIAAWISDKEIFDFKLHRYQDRFKIALFDTEQGQYDFQRNLKFIKKLCNTENIYNDFDAFLFRQDNSQDIILMIEQYLKINPDVGVIVIDGILDCIDNMNDEGASKSLIRTLKRWAALNDILIITVLHLGKKDLTSIGHIGSASDRYAQSTLLIEKTKQGTYNCQSKYLRSAKDFDTIEIYYDEVTGSYYKV